MSRASKAAQADADVDAGLNAGDTVSGRDQARDEATDASGAPEPGVPEAALDGESDGDDTGDGESDGGDDGTSRGDPAEEATSFPGDTAEEQLDECAQIVEALSKERDDMRSLAQRVQADFENYKRRVDTQRAEQVDRAAEEVVRSLLEVLDDCDLAASHDAEQVAPIANKLVSILERQGLSRVAETEVTFDPNLHEAVLSEEGDGDEPVVAEVMRTGYQWRKRLLRPAMVKVRS